MVFHERLRFDISPLAFCDLRILSATNRGLSSPHPRSMIFQMAYSSSVLKMATWSGRSLGLQRRSGYSRNWNRSSSSRGSWSSPCTSQDHSTPALRLFRAHISAAPLRHAMLILIHHGLFHSDYFSRSAVLCVFISSALLCTLLSLLWNHPLSPSFGPDPLDQSNTRYVARL